VWTSFVELIRVFIFGAAHVCGGSLGGGIFVASLAVRLALLPLTLRLARNAMEQQRRLLRIRPQLERLQKRFANDPLRLLQETQALHRRHGIRLISPRSLVGMAVQAPLLGGLFAAVRTGLGSKVRFLWIADLARGDALLAFGVAALSAGAVWLTPTSGPPHAATVTVVFIGLATAVFLWSASSAVAVSVGAGALVSSLQSWLVGREVRRGTT